MIHFPSSSTTIFLLLFLVLFTLSPFPVSIATSSTIPFNISHFLYPRINYEEYPQSSPNPPSFLEDVLKGIAEREKWDLQDLRVSKLDVKKSKFGTFRKYEFRVRIGKTEFIFMMADEVSQWKSFHFPNKNESDFESLVKEIGSKVTLDVLKIQGPFELYATGDDYLSLTFPLNSSYTGLKKILVGEGITVEVKGADEISMFNISDLLKLVNGSILTKSGSGQFRYMSQSSCIPLLPVHVRGPASVLAYITRNPDLRIETASVSKRSIKLLSEKCYTRHIYRKWSLYMGLTHSRSHHSHSYSSNSFHDQHIDMEMSESITTQTDVSFILAKHVFSKEIKGDTNLVFSPLSIQIVLGLIAAGSKGTTKDQLLCFLKSKSIDELNSLYSHLVNIIFVDGSPNGGPCLSVANGVWIDQTLPFKPSFKKVVDNVHKAASNSVDFQNKATEVANQVNQWAKMKTNDLIKEILPHGTVNNMTRLIFANALYFKGAWNDKFNASETKDYEFHLLRGGSIKAPFMTSNKKQYAVAFDGFKVLVLHYTQGRDTTRRFCMYLILPDARDGLPALIDKISSEPGFLNHHVPFEKAKMRKLLIPKFKTTFGFEASKVLKGLGVTSPFSSGGLTEMVDSALGDRLFVSQIFHKSFIEVNEEGTEAAAVTASVVMTKSLIIEKEIDFVADHPFMFLIRDDATGVVLFIGSVLNPLAG